jgi:DNA-binding LacI/PurR family transcriptional regulator
LGGQPEKKVSVKKPTIADVARKAHVSIATVSRVMNKTGAVEEALRAQVEAAAKELAYLPNRYAQVMRRNGNFRGGRAKTIAVIIPAVANTFLSHLLEHILKTADDNGILVIVLSCHGDSEREVSCIETAFSMGVDGLLYCPSTETAAEKLFDFFPRDFPVVVFYRRGVVDGVPHIFHDNEQGGYIAAKYLLHQGRRNIAVFGSFWHSVGVNLFDMLHYEKRGVYSSIDRLAGHIRALGEYGIDMREELLFSLTGFGFDAGKECAREFLSRICDFDAIICANDEVAAGVITALQEQHYSIPEAVSVIGYDDLSFATAARPMLTTVRQDPAVLGKGAMEMICARMRGEKTADRSVEMSLVIRDSTAVKKDRKL